MTEGKDDKTPIPENMDDATRKMVQMQLKAIGVEFSVVDGEITLPLDAVCRLIVDLKYQHSLVDKVRASLISSSWEVQLDSVLAGECKKHNEKYPTSDEMETFVKSELTNLSGGALAKLLGGLLEKAGAPPLPPIDSDKAN